MNGTNLLPGRAAFKSTVFTPEWGSSSELFIPIGVGPMKTIPILWVVGSERNWVMWVVGFGDNLILGVVRLTVN